MAVELDPEENETGALYDLLPPVSAPRVLEIGCGDGRLTRRFADRAGSVLAIDPDADAIARFRGTMPQELRGRVELRVGGVESLTRRDAPFDLVLLSWSL